MLGSMQKSAYISSCGKFRYTLSRRWGEGKPMVFIMLNPSTADAEQDDATIRRCIGFAKSHGHNAIEVVNLFAYRATKPSDLKAAGYPVGTLNGAYIHEAISNAAVVVLAWGDNARDLPRVDEVLRQLKSEYVEPYVLKLTTKGIPSHPLMLRSDCKIVKFEG